MLSLLQKSMMARYVSGYFWKHRNPGPAATVGGFASACAATKAEESARASMKCIVVRIQLGCYGYMKREQFLVKVCNVRKIRSGLFIPVIGRGLSEDHQRKSWWLCGRNESDLLCQFLDIVHAEMVAMQRQQGRRYRSMPTRGLEKVSVSRQNYNIKLELQSIK